MIRKKSRYILMSGASNCKCRVTPRRIDCNKKHTLKVCFVRRIS